MSKKMKIKFKRGKAKIKLKGDDALPVEGEDMQRLLGSVLQRAVPLANAPAVAALVQPEVVATLSEAAEESETR